MALTKKEFNALPHKLVPISARFATKFLYGDTEYTLGKLVYNKVSECLTTSLSWLQGVEAQRVDSLVLLGGTDIVKQHNTGLPSLVATNATTKGEDIRSIEDLRLLIVEEFDSYFITGK